MDWELIFRKHSPGVYQYLLTLSGNNQEAEDLLQETFIRAMRSISSLREPDKIHSWLMTIARNLFLDHRKKRLRRNTDSIEDSLAETVNQASGAESPEDFTIRSDFMSSLRDTLKNLSETYRTAFTLGVMQGLSYQEVAEITGWSSAMVKSNIFRARKKVADAMIEFQR